MTAKEKEVLCHLPPPRSLCLVHKQHFVTAPLSLSCVDTQWWLPWGDTDPSRKVQGCVMTNKIRNTQNGSADVTGEKAKRDTGA